MGKRAAAPAGRGTKKLKQSEDAEEEEQQYEDGV